MFHFQPALTQLKKQCNDSFHKKTADKLREQESLEQVKASLLFVKDC